MGAGALAALGKGLGFAHDFFGGNVSGYHEVYPTKERNRTELFIILALFLLIIMATLMFALKKLK